ncbi:hypothetical protein [Azospirillum picis]|uniref:Uncharacterized protein n=1 Tax=Azospirillum picis TaxID=488438 RepID=A0ABU0MPJ1_9PROT|nr:hypothetical protein [Azospirillum picis]MBP2301558.1 hypothetical protein [Azospirillum picis]MDQ0535390.1 hypothetical protein [Azospirillum picis]
MANLITSQHYLNDEIVEEKRAAQDYVVTLSPEFEYAGERYQVIIDGTHSLAAALLDGVEPEVEVAGRENDTISLLERGNIEGFLEAQWTDGDYHHFGLEFVETGRPCLVW